MRFLRKSAQKPLYVCAFYEKAPKNRYTFALFMKKSKARKIYNMFTCVASRYFYDSYDSYDSYGPSVSCFPFAYLS